jgi:photosystem II stability/assembly factor-like uncharacterized protein
MKHTFPKIVILLLLGMVACLPLSTPLSVPTDEAAAPIPATDTPIPTPTLPVVTAPRILDFNLQDPSNGWAVTAAGLVRTTDGGLTWYNVTPSGLAAISQGFSFYLYDNSNAWLVLPVTYYDSGTLYHTSDGGYTWNSAPVPFSNASLQFFDSRNGVALVGLGVGAGSMAVAFFATTDGGVTWNRVYINDPTVSGAGDSLPLGGLKGAYAFSDPLHGWVGGSIPMSETFYLYATEDGGTTWGMKDLPWPVDRAGYFGGVDEIVFTSLTEGYIVVSLVGDLSEDYIYRTTDGGQTWSQVPGMIPRSRQFTILPGTVIFCWEDSGVIYYTPDGVSWYQNNPNIDFSNSLRRMQFVDVSTGFILAVDSSDHATLYRTQDSGVSWTVLIP